MEQWLEQSNLEHFLKTGTTLAVLSIDVKELKRKKRLNKSESCLGISWFFYFERILKETQVLPMLREDMMLAVSSLSVGWVNIELLHWCFKYSEKCLWE